MDWTGVGEGGGGARRCAWNCAEMLLDHRFDLRDVEIADGDDRHQVGSIPILIEATKHRRLRLLNADIGANRKMRRILGILEYDRDERASHPLGRAKTGAPFLEHDATLVDDRG